MANDLDEIHEQIFVAAAVRYFEAIEMFGHSDPRTASALQTALGAAPIGLKHRILQIDPGVLRRIPATGFLEDGQPVHDRAELAELLGAHEADLDDWRLEGVDITLCEVPADETIFRKQ